MSPLVLSSPAKINLSLAITGRRPDGFHSLVSVVTPLAWGDTLRVEPAADGEASLVCDDPAVPVGEDNLVIRAARRFRERSGWTGGVAFRLEKRIPMGAGLGGGSSNAVAALRGLNALAAQAGRALEPAALVALAAELGSDCPLFFADGPVVMRGRGECIEPVPATVASTWGGRRVLVFRPAFGVATAWAYRALAARPDWYLPAEQAEASLARWFGDDGGELSAGRLFNTLEAPVFAKYAALPAMLEWLRERHGLSARMSGSGSACFALLPDGLDTGPVEATIREGFGPGAWVVETTLP
ncbi:MAG: 4-(cytidine 5'-diphospho)-2-C-methyl-D-erythritol kinase [Verrucomicrobiota bacterium]